MFQRLGFKQDTDHDAHVESWQMQLERDRKIEELEPDDYVPLWLGDVEERIIPGVDGPPYPFEVRCRNRVLTEAEYAAEQANRSSVASTRGRSMRMVDATEDVDFGKVIDGE